jgi:hypothetical protein
MNIDKMLKAARNEPEYTVKMAIKDCKDTIASPYVLDNDNQVYVAGVKTDLATYQKMVKDDPASINHAA